MMKRWVMALFIIAIALTGCVEKTVTPTTIPPSPASTPAAGFCGWSTYGECSSDSDCIASGCSSQVCQSRYEEPVITTCEWRDCYDAEIYDLECQCVGKKCQWAILEDITAEEAHVLIQSSRENGNFVIIDVRTSEEYSSGHIENAINLNYHSENFKQSLNKLNRTRTYLVYCQSGQRSGMTLDIMKDLGFIEVYNMLGGIDEWKAKGFPVVSSTPSFS
jgi:eight-cysteine-cluster-containing protein